MVSKTTKHYPSKDKTKVKYKILIKNNRFWIPYRPNGIMFLANHPNHANNLGKLINPFHKSLNINERNNKKVSKP